MWEVTIRKVENGFVVEWWDELDDGNYRQFEQVFEEPDNENGEMECMISMLHFVKEHFGVYHSKHSKFNVYIGLSEKENG